METTPYKPLSKRRQALTVVGWVVLMLAICAACYWAIAITWAVSLLVNKECPHIPAC
ncbi:MAG TPA: hypothetical protein VF040_16060 [Ktedonobacterales bacterium]